MNYHYPKQIRIGSFSTSENELKDLLKAWLAISAAFGILIANSFFSMEFYYALIISSLSVGLGFLAHELSHKVIAQRYGHFAEFRAFNSMLLLAIIMSFLGFIIIAPGAVMISGPVGRRRNGKISAGGPAASIVIAIIFFLLLFLQVRDIPQLLSIVHKAQANIMALPLNYSIPAVGFFINAMIAAFNLLPFGIFDGRKIFEWNRIVYIVMCVIAFSLAVVSFIRV